MSSERGPRPSRPPASLPGTAAVLVVLALAAACGGDPTGPEEPLGPLVPDLEPFYWFDGEKVALRIMPDTFSVRAPGGDAVAAASEALSGRGLEVRAIRELPDGHRLIEVPGAGRERAPTISDRLWNHPAITFAAPGYRVEEGEKGAGSYLLALNSLTVRFRPAVGEGVIHRLARRLGTPVKREPVPEKGWDYHLFHFPEDVVGGRDMLDIASIYDRHELAEWAGINRVAEIVLYDAAPGDAPADASR